MNAHDYPQWLLSFINDWNYRDPDTRTMAHDVVLLAVLRQGSNNVQLVCKACGRDIACGLRILYEKLLCSLCASENDADFSAKR